MSLNIVKVGLFAIGCCVAGAIFLFTGIKEIGLSKKEPLAFNSLTADRMKMDAVIAGDIDFIVDYVAEKTETKEGQPASSGKVTRRWYVAPLENGNVVIVEAGSDMMRSLDRLLDDTWAAFDDESAAAPTPVSFKGVVKSLDEEVVSFLDEYISDVCAGDAAEMEKLRASILPNVVMYHALNDGTPKIIGGLVFILIGGGIGFMIFRSVRGTRRQEDYYA